MFTSKFKITAGISLAIIAAGIICMIVFGGLNLGIDFTGGSILSVDIKADFDTDVVREVLTEYDVADAPIVKSGDTFQEAQIRMRDIGDDESNEMIEGIVAGIQKTYPDAELTSIDRVGGTASADLVRNALLAVVVSCLLMLVYIWIRFELYSGIAAVIALVNDVLIMISVVAITQMQVNSGFIAACLTIVGYSINNTIVIFDRIRDNKKTLKSKAMSFNDLVNLSIKETLTRTINTSVTTLIMITCLYIFGVESIKEFSLPIIVGLVAGTYSAIFLSGPLWALFANKFDKNYKAEQKAIQKKNEQKNNKKKNNNKQSNTVNSKKNNKKKSAKA